MLTIDQIAANHNINPAKENFPVNTIKLFYFLFIYSLAPETAADNSQKMLHIIPLLSAILKKRSQTRRQGEQLNINYEWESVREETSKLKKIINSPAVDTSLNQLFATSLPTQETLLLNIVTQSQSGEKPFSPTDILATLKLRAMDSVAYSTVVCNLINKPEHNIAIHYLINLAYQVNDLLDSILYAKEDTEKKNFSPFEVIRKSSKNSTEAKLIIKALLEKLMSDKTQVTIPVEMQQLVDQFFKLLTDIIGEVNTEAPVAPIEKTLDVPAPVTPVE